MSGNRNHLFDHGHMEPVAKGGSTCAAPHLNVLSAAEGVTSAAGPVPPLAKTWLSMLCSSASGVSRACARRAKSSPSSRSTPADAACAAGAKLAFPRGGGSEAAAHPALHPSPLLPGGGLGPLCASAGPPCSPAVSSPCVRSISRSDESRVREISSRARSSLAESRPESASAACVSTSSTSARASTPPLPFTQSWSSSSRALQLCVPTSVSWGEGPAEEVARLPKPGIMASAGAER
mmetsp:Transcript_12965/g.34589  ORF Transcript_12965/g.34589 Transcript_12965/m.34589 type:complete len:236 (+) Transcript_12965:133-840(+)